MADCKFPDCGRRTVAQGLCGMHYQQMKKGKPLTTGRFNRLCSLEGCGRPHEAHGLCQQHYGQLRRGITPHLKGPVRPAIEVRADAIEKLVLLNALSSTQLMKSLKCARSAINAAIRLLKNEQRIYIAAWAEPPNIHGQHIALWRAGNKPSMRQVDATDPTRPPRRRIKTMRGVAAPVLQPASPFDALFSREV